MSGGECLQSFLQAIQRKHTWTFGTLLYLGGELIHKPIHTFCEFFLKPMTNHRFTSSGTPGQGLWCWTYPGQSWQNQVCKHCTDALPHASSRASHTCPNSGEHIPIGLVSKSLISTWNACIFCLNYIFKDCTLKSQQQIFLLLPQATCP